MCGPTDLVRPALRATSWIARYGTDLCIRARLTRAAATRHRGHRAQRSRRGRAPGRPRHASPPRCASCQAIDQRRKGAAHATILTTRGISPGPTDRGSAARVIHAARPSPRPLRQAQGRLSPSGLSLTHKSRCWTQPYAEGVAQHSPGLPRPVSGHPGRMPTALAA